MTDLVTDYELRITPPPVAVITGAGSGIGRGVALAWARRGGVAVLVGRREAALQSVAGEVAALGGTAFVVSADVATESGRALVVQRVAAEFAAVDVLVHCAAVLHEGPFAARSEAEVVQSVAVNLVAPLLLTHQMLPLLRGGVVLVGSLASHVPMPGATLYTAGKMGLRGFGEALRTEIAPRRVLLAYPPATRTAMTESMWQRFGRRVPGYRLAAPMDVGEVIVRAWDRGRRDLIWPGDRALALAYRLAPRLLGSVVARIAPKLFGDLSF